MALNKGKGTNKSTKKGTKSGSQKKLTKTSLKALKKAELVELALGMKLIRISGLKKDEIIERILQAESQAVTTSPTLFEDKNGAIFPHPIVKPKIITTKITTPKIKRIIVLVLIP